MNRTNKARLAAHAAIIKALAHPSRLLIVEELAKRPRCVCDLTKLIGARMPTVSNHLTVLKHAGIIQHERRGTQLIYHLLCPCILEFIACITTVVRSNARRQMALAA